jgi:pyruvate/2-oxoglutarate dehydrogenase complex dihydrolipoamide acyltransferase (E2) component
MPNIELNKYTRPSMWRKMSVVNWRHPTDPQVYARMEVDMGRALEYARKESERGGVRIGPTHLALRAIALCLREYPDTNAIIRWNRVYTRKRVNVFCHVAIPGKKPDLSGFVVRDADAKDLVAIARELQAKVKAIRAGTDEELARSRQMLDKIPSWLYKIVLRALCFLEYTLNLNLGRLGIPQDPFGGAAVTTVGSFGISEAYAALSPITRTPILVAVGKVEPRPVVREGSIVVRPMCTLCGTFDHRIMDGYMAGKLAKFVTRYLSDPERYEQRSAGATSGGAGRGELS